MATIPYPKIWNPGEILTAADLNAEFAAVTSISSIASSALAPDAGITTANLAPLAVTTGRMAVGASTRTGVSAFVNTGLSFSVVETDVVTLPAIVTRGGIVLLYGYWALLYTTAGGATTVTYRIYRSGGVIPAATITYDLHPLITATALAAPPPPLPFSDQPAAGSYVYKITAQTTGSGLSTSGATAGIVLALEFA